MNNDFKIRRDNIDADVRSLHGQVNEMSKAVDNRGSTQALFGAAPEDKVRRLQLVTLPLVSVSCKRF